MLIVTPKVTTKYIFLITKKKNQVIHYTHTHTQINRKQKASNGGTEEQKHI